MKIVPRNVLKSFSIASIVGAMLGAANNGDPKLIALSIQINRAMKVFSIKAGSKTYWAVSNQVHEIWVEIAAKHNNTLNEDELSVFIEMVCSLISKKDFKEFLNMNTYVTTEKMADDKKSGILMTVLSLDKQLNKLYGTPPVATRDTLGLILNKTIKPKRVKKKRDSSNKMIKVKTASSGKLKEAERKASSRNFLRDRIANAKKIAEMQKG